MTHDKNYHYLYHSPFLPLLFSLLFVSPLLSLLLRLLLLLTALSIAKERRYIPSAL